MGLTPHFPESDSGWKTPGLRPGLFLIQHGSAYLLTPDTASHTAATAGSSAATVRDKLYPKRAFSLLVRGTGATAGENDRLCASTETSSNAKSASPSTSAASWAGRFRYSHWSF